jgi:outer membrane receptor protein involved in Fe transport
MKTKTYLERSQRHTLLLAAFAAWIPAVAVAQSAPTPPKDEEEETVTLSPFEVSGERDTGYAATSSLAGSRLNTRLKDVPSAIQVVTAEFMADTGSTNLQDVLLFTTNTEVAGIQGNFYGGNADDGSYRSRMLVNPQFATRVRGLNTADLTRNFFPTSIPLDSYNTSRVDIQRGPNSILFGLGSPAGIINNTPEDPNLNKLQAEAQVRVSSYGSHREVLDVSVPVIKDTLGVRVAGLYDREKFRQDFTFNDDRRVYGAIRWQPKLARGIFTQLDVRGESGKIRANRPVAVTAADFISNWFGPLNRYVMYNPLTSNGIPQDPNGGQHRELSHYFAGAPARDWWNASPATIFRNPNSSAIGNGHVDAYRQRDGTPWGGLSGVTNPNLDEGGTGVWNKNTAAYFSGNAEITQRISAFERETGRTFSGFGSSLWPTQMILGGPLAFIDQTIQGPNKREWNNFDTAEISLSQTYLDGALGFNLGYYEESYRYGFANAISTNRVTVDVNAVLRDNSPNPDLGRPAIIGPSSGEMVKENRDAFRGTVYYKFDIGRHIGREKLLSRIFGEQTFTGVYSDYHYENLNRQFNLYAWDVNTYGRPFLNSTRHQSWWGIHYIGDSLANVANFRDIPGSAIRPVGVLQTPASTSNTLVFDPSNNTWRTATVNLISYENSLDSLYTGASQGFDDTKSTSFVWQGKLLNDAIVPLFGWRRDRYERWDKPSSLVRDQFGTPLPFSPDWNYSATKPLSADEQRRSWGLVLHTNQVLGLFKTSLPKGIELSLNYNESNSFRPSEVGTDIYGQKLASPSGETKDYGFLVTVEEKVALKVTWFKTIQKNTTLSDPSGMIGWAKGGVARTMNALAQETWGAGTPNQTTPERLVNKWFFGDSYNTAIANQPLPANWRSQLSTLVNEPLRIRRAAVPGSPTYVAQGTINPATGLPFLSPYLDAEEMEYRRAWFAARSDAEWFRPLENRWVVAEQFAKITGDDYRIWGENVPAGQKLTNDLISKGVEIEVTANPTRNWRLTFNASRVEAVRSNILADWAEFIEKNKDLWFDGYNNNPGGPSQLNYWTIDGFADIRHWGGDTTYSSVQDTFGGRMMQNVYGPYANAIAGNGQSVSELRKWRFNFVTNYQFSTGWLRNVNVGGAVRWQDKAAIGYYPRWNSDVGIWVTDAASPIYGPSETNYDGWIGYRRKLTDKITWEIQLNVRDLFADDDLIPIQANPDGTVAQVRIPSRTTWMVTNTFKF